MGKQRIEKRRLPSPLTKLSFSLSLSLSQTIFWLIWLIHTQNIWLIQRTCMHICIYAYMHKKHLCQILCHPNPRQGRKSFWRNNWSLCCTKSRLLFLPLPTWNPRNLVCIWDDHYEQGWQWHRLVKTVDWRMLSFSLILSLVKHCITVSWTFLLIFWQRLSQSIYINLS